jgi:hypothetical protein
LRPDVRATARLVRFAAACFARAGCRRVAFRAGRRAPLVFFDAARFDLLVRFARLFPAARRAPFFELFLAMSFD